MNKTHCGSAKLGLVLSGGGAMGAYQVGVVKALQEMGTQVDAVAGASIGALNAAVIAASPNMCAAARRLEELWGDLAAESPLEMQVPNYLRMLAACGLNVSLLSTIGSLSADISSRMRLALPDWLEERIAWLTQGAVLSDAPLRQHLGEYLDEKALQNGLPLYVSLFRSGGAQSDLMACLLAELGLSDAPDSEFVHVQSLPQAQQTEALLASAAIPVLFSPKVVNGTSYVDGGLGGWQRMQGNTPITPLIKAGCNLVVVTHLTEGSPWSRHDFPETTILEIRPRQPIGKGRILDLLGFDAKKIPYWIEQGYSDAMRCLGRVKDVMLSVQMLENSERALEACHQEQAVLDVELSRAMRRLEP